MIEAYWAEHVEPLRTEDELKRLVERVRALRRPTLVSLEHENGRTLFFGVGHPARISVLGYVAEDVRSFHSVAVPPNAGKTEFWDGEELSDFDLADAIPEAKALEAALEFVRTGDRPTGVRWEQD